MKKLENTLVFLAVFLVFITVSLILIFKAGYLAQEISVRSGIAADLLRSDERGRQGLVCSIWWAPLPTLLQLVFGAFPSLIASGVAGVAISSFGGALMCYFLFKSLSYLGLKRPSAYAILILLALNPWVLFYSATGSSEALLLGVLSGAFWCLILWYHEKKLSGLVGLSIYASLLPLIKHQALLLSLVMLIPAIAVSGNGTKPRSRRIEGTIYLAMSPVIYTLGLWFLFNWLIMGDMLYFLKGVYIGQTYSGSASASLAINAGRMQAAPWTLPFLAQFYISPFVPVGLVLLATGLFWHRNIFSYVLLGLIAILPGYHSIMIFRGQSFSIMEDMLPAVLISVLIAAFFLNSLIKQKNSASGFASMAVVLLLLVATAGSYIFIAAGEINMPLNALPSSPFLKAKGELNEETRIKEFILSKEDDSKIAIVGFCGYNFIKKSDGGDEFVHTINLDLPLTLRKTRGKTLYFIIPKPDGVAAFDSINLNLPGLFYMGETSIGSPGIKAHFMLENKEFQNWRVFTIVRPQQNETIFGSKVEPKKGS